MGYLFRRLDSFPGGFLSPSPTSAGKFSSRVSRLTTFEQPCWRRTDEKTKKILFPSHLVFQSTKRFQTKEISARQSSLKGKNQDKDKRQETRDKRQKTEA